MITAVARDRVEFDGSKSPDFRVGSYLGKVDAIDRGPQAFLLEFEPGYVIKPHFHLVDQFQVFVRGGAKFGKEDIGEITVHYTDGFTPYGPIVMGDAGCAMWNLRGRADLGAWFMPESRDNLQRRAGRSRTVHTVKADSASLNSDVLTTEVLPFEEDGLGVLSTVVAPGMELPSGMARGGGRYELVVTGNVEHAGELLGVDSIVFTSAGEDIPQLVAGPAGAQVLSLQVPHP